MGLTHDSDGPAGMFCNSIRSEGLECKGARCKVAGMWRRIKPVSLVLRCGSIDRGVRGWNLVIVRERGGLEMLAFI
jgi:hypothetical protein